MTVHIEFGSEFAYLIHIVTDCYRLQVCGRLIAELEQRLEEAAVEVALPSLSLMPMRVYLESEKG